MKITKEQQKEINILVEKEYIDCISVFNECDNFNLLPKPIRLKSCNAWIYGIDNYFILKSYSTIIACVNVDTGIMFDFLRLVYGYTSTSCQHISKFKKIYALYYNKEVVWRDVK